MGDANTLPKKATLDLLTQIILQKLVEGYETKAIVDTVLAEIEHATDREFLAELKILWEPETFRHFRWRMSHAHDDDFLFDVATSFQELSAEQQKQLRKEIREKTTGRPYRPN